MTTIALNLQAVRHRIEQAAAAASRPPTAITLLAVSKTFPASYIEEAHAAGQRAFGENYVQDAVEKMTLLRHLPLEWHFIGPVQSNKTAAIAGHFQWVHSIDRARIAERLNAARSPDLPRLDVCIQVNVSGEGSKSGVTAGAAQGLAQTVAGLPRLRLRGLMAIPEPTSDVQLQRRRFALLHELQERLVAAGHALDTLSMGMSDDLEAAVSQGATIVRVGTAIFGHRR